MLDRPNNYGLAVDDVGAENATYGYVTVTCKKDMPTLHFTSQLRGEVQRDSLFALQQLRREKASIKWEIEMVGVFITTLQIECDNIGTLVFNELQQEYINLAGLLNGVKFWAERFDVWQDILPFQIEHLQEVLGDHFPPLQWDWG